MPEASLLHIWSAYCYICITDKSFETKMLPAALQTTKSTKYKGFHPLLLFHLYLTLTGRRAYTAYIGTQQNKHGDHLQTVLCGNLIIDPITNIWDGVNICVLPWIGAESSWRVGVLSQAAQANGDSTPEQIIAAIGVYCPHAHCAMKCLFTLIYLMCLVAHGCRSLLGSSLANQWLLLVWSCSRSSFPYVHMYALLLY